MKIGPFTPPDVREAILREQEGASVGGVQYLSDFQLTIANTDIVFESHWGAPLGSITQRFLQPFVKLPQGEPNYRVQTIRVDDNFQIPRHSIGNTVGSMSQRGWKITTPNWEIEWTKENQKSVICHYYKHFDTALQAIKLFLAHQLIFEGRGLFLHAAAALHQGKTYIFLGSSGAGKSTSAYHTPGRLLADETVALVNSQHGQILSQGTPFGGEHFPSADLGPNPVFLFVEKSDRNARKTIPTRNAVARLLSQIVLVPFASLEMWDQAAVWVERIIENHPVEILEAKSDGSFWKDLLT